MIRSPSGLFVLCCVVTTAATNATFGPVIVVKNTTLQTQSANDVVKKVAGMDPDIMKAFQKVSKGSGAILAELVQGKVPDMWNVMNTYVPVLVGLANPLLGAIAGFVLSFLGGIFGSKGAPNIYQKIMDAIPKLVQQEIIKHDLDSVHNKILDIVDSQLFLSDIVQDLDDQQDNVREFVRALNDQKRGIFGGCFDLVGTEDLALHNQATTMTSCQDWRHHGSVVHEVLFVSLHINALVEYANLFANSTAPDMTVQKVLTEVHDKGNTYLNLLDQSLSAFSSHRNNQFEHVSFKTSYYSYKSDLLEFRGGKDNWSGLDIVEWCGYSRTRVVNRPHSSWFMSFIAAVENCVEGYWEAVLAELKKVGGQISDIREIVGVTARLSDASKLLV